MIRSSWQREMTQARETPGRCRQSRPGENLLRPAGLSECPKGGGRETTENWRGLAEEAGPDAGSVGFARPLTNSIIAQIRHRTRDTPLPNHSDKMQTAGHELAQEVMCGTNRNQTSPWQPLGYLLARERRPARHVRDRVGSWVRQLPGWGESSCGACGLCRAWMVVRLVRFSRTWSLVRNDARSSRQPLARRLERNPRIPR